MTKQEDPRRSFLIRAGKWVGGAAIGGIVGAEAARAFEAAGAVVHPGVQAETPSPTLDEISLRVSIPALLGGPVDGCFAGDEHMNWQNKGKPHPSNAAPAHALADALFPDRCVPLLFKGQSSGNLVSFGSTTSNEHVRSVFSESNPLGLPITYSAHKQPGQLARWVGHEWYRTERRALRIEGELDLAGGRHLYAGDYLRADVDQDERVTVDWLLLTVLPNYLQSNSLEAGERLLIVGGLHGTATESFPKVATHKSTIETIVGGLGPVGLGQALVRVAGIEHRDTTASTEAHEFTTVGVWPLRESELRAAIRRAALAH